MKKNLIGRKEEVKILKKAIESNEAELVAVLGRRRVGKTFLIKSVYEEEIVFEITGIYQARTEEQLINFTDQLQEFSQPQFPIQQPPDWIRAFQLLRTYLKDILGKQKVVIFIDELPWLATHKSGFLRAFGYFWNSWASHQNIVVVICGSAASWMINKVVNDRGGLHNRITRRIDLEPFTLGETESYLESRNMYFERYQIVQMYMALGGIPHYLKEIEKGKSAAKNINQICFSKTSLLKNEFERLFPSLFSQAEKHTSVVRILAEKRQGLTRQQITEMTAFSNGGGLTKVLEELVHSGFISTFKPFGKKKKDRVYRLTDEYSLFYLKFIENIETDRRDAWQYLSQTQSYKIWAGYAFESICLKHIYQIKKALSIAGIYSISASFYTKRTDDHVGAQMDLLIDRNDQTINLFEIKFYNEPFTISKAYAASLRSKMSVFRAATKTKKQLFWIMITVFGLNENQYSNDLVSQNLIVDDLFD